MSANREKQVSENEAIDFLNLVKNAYTTAVKESDSSELISGLRNEIRYWEDYLHTNWPEERAKREPWGGSPDPMTKQELLFAMEQVYGRMEAIIQRYQDARDIVPDLNRFEVIQGMMFSALKTVCAVLEETIRNLN